MKEWSGGRRSRGRHQEQIRLLTYRVKSKRDPQKGAFLILDPSSANQPFPFPLCPHSDIYRPGKKIWPPSAGYQLEARQDCQRSPPSYLGSWQWHVSSFVSSRLSQPVAPIPVPEEAARFDPGGHLIQHPFGTEWVGRRAGGRRGDGGRRWP